MVLGASSLLDLEAPTVARGRYDRAGGTPLEPSSP